MANRDYENKYIKMGHRYIAGVDEAGRGPLAGPVVIAAVILPNNYNNQLIDDSKKLSEKQRNELYGEIIKNALAYKIVVIDEATIDKVNIYQASKLGMINAIKGIKHPLDLVLTDAMPIGELKVEVVSLIKGDSKSISIAAASILAKVTRDQLMVNLHNLYPQYGFDKHKGYPTKAHLAAIAKYGITKYHRLSYKPVASAKQLSLFEE
jgi:ribonuclease HII